MKVDECVDNPRSWKKRVLLPRSSDLSSLSVYHVRKHLAGSNHLEGTGSEWAAGAHVHQEDVCGAAPMRRAEMEVARGPRGDREVVLTAQKARIPASTKLPLRVLFCLRGGNNQPTKVA